MSSPPRTGARVWFWSRAKGLPAQKHVGTVISTNGVIARVRIDGTHAVPVRVVEVKRLKETNE